MGIEISSGGVSKTYRYYPYDAFYVDANGNVNTSGNGQQVKEAYFNGTKYYPEENLDALVYKCNASITDFAYDVIDSYGRVHDTYPIGTITSKEVSVIAYNKNEWYYRNDSWFGESLFSKVAPQSLSYIWPEIFIIKYIKADFDSSVLDQNPDKWHIFNKNRFINNTFNALSNGITISHRFSNAYLPGAMRDNIENGAYYQFSDCYFMLKYGSGSTRYTRGIDDTAFRFDVIDSPEYAGVAPIYLFIGGGQPCVLSGGHFNYPDGCGLSGTWAHAEYIKQEWTHSSMFMPTANDFLNN
jgi:hypothetical protein